MTKQYSAAPDDLRPPPSASEARHRVYEVIFGHATARGRLFDIVLILAIMASVLAVMLESVASIRAEYGGALRILEWVFTVGFTIEYAFRLWCSKPWRYARSFFGIIDLLAVLPTYLSLFLPGGQVLAIVRILRVLRVFRILKLVRYVGEAAQLGAALRAARYKITVFLVGVTTLVVIVGSLMYLIEGPATGFTSIPRSVYWAVVTLTTVGFGDITPKSAWGQGLATLVMLMGYAIIAVPTGIVTAELAEASRRGGQAVCPGCGRMGHDGDAVHCKACGTHLTRGIDPG